MIYVLSSSDRTCVKIGFSKKSPVERCEQLEAAHPDQLVLISVLRGDKSVERHLHGRFDALRVPSRREWFQKGREIEEWLRADDGIVTRCFYDWLLMRRNNKTIVGAFSRDFADLEDFPRTTKSYFAVEDYLRDRGASFETRLSFDSVWRDFLRDEVRKDLEAYPVESRNVSMPFVRGVRAERPVRAELMDPELESTHREHVVGLFDRLLREALAKNPERARSIDTILCFKIEGAGDWIVDCSKEAPQPTCMRGVSNEALCTVEISVRGFASMLSDPNVGMKLYFNKELRLLGDTLQVVKIPLIFELALP